MGAADLVSRAFRAFGDDVSSPPPMTLRGGNAVDGYARADPYDAALDAPTDEYLEGFAFWGIGYLDAQSWRHYLPRLIDYALRHPKDPAMVVEALVRSLRPPDRYPPRLGSLSPEQESLVREFLELLALGEAVKGVETDAQQALEEWWLPNPRSRPSAEEISAARRAPVIRRAVGEGRCRLTLPQAFTGSGLRDIPEESRQVETWGGPLCADALAVVAVNTTPVAVRSLGELVKFRGSLFSESVAAREWAVPGARRALRLDGFTPGDSPAEPQALTMILADTGDEIVTVTIRSWPREDVRREVERIVESIEIAR